MPYAFHSPAYADPMPVVADARPDGVVVNITDPRWATMLTRRSIATVNIGGRNDAVHLPRVGVDDVWAGRMAARYLADQAAS